MTSRYGWKQHVIMDINIRITIILRRRAMFLDTANIQQITEAMRTGVFRGVTTNPTILLKEGKGRLKQIEEILATDAGILFVQLLGSTVDEQFSDYKLLKSRTENKRIAMKVPMDFTGLETVRRIKEDDKDTMVLGTAIYSADQAILAALAGCDSVAPYVNRMSTNGIDPFAAIEMMRLFFDDRDLKTKIVAASFKSTDQILKALQAGAHTCTIPYDLFLQMINKELAGNAVRVFNEHGHELEEKQMVRG